MAILFVLMGVGFVYRRRRFFSDEALHAFTDLVLYIVTPCLIIHAFQRPFDSHQLANLGVAFIVAMLTHVFSIILANLIFRSRDVAKRAVLRYATVFSNAGFMALPLEFALLGADGAFYGSVYVVVFNLMCWSWGLCEMRGSLSGKSNRLLYINPGTVGITLGLPLFLFSIHLPDIITTSLARLEEVNTPVSMIVVGAQLADAKLGDVFKSASAWLVTILRLIIFPLMVLGALYYFRHALNADPLMAVAIVTATSAPVGATTAMFAKSFKRDESLGAGLVASSTLLSALTMPLIVGLALRIFQH